MPIRFAEGESRRPTPALRTLVALPALLAGLAAAASAQNVLQVGLGGFATIQNAVNAAAPGDTIRIGAGAWAAFSVNKSLRFVADPPCTAAVLSNFAHITLTLAANDKVTFDSLLFLDSLGGFGGFDCQGGMVSMSNCTVATSFGMTAQNCVLALRGCTLLAQLASPALTVTNGQLDAVASSFRSLGAPSTSLQLTGSRAELSRCEGVGSNATTLAPAVPGGPAVTLASSANGPSQAWIVDSTFVGGGSVAPLAGAPALLAQNPVRTHRCVLDGGNGGGGQVAGVQGQEVTGPLLGLSTTKGDPALGGTFAAEMRGEPGDALTLYVAFDLLQPVANGVLEQPVFGLTSGGALIFNVTADGQGRADVVLNVPLSPQLLYLNVWLRGVDLSRSPAQGSALAYCMVR